ncbi:MAG TPA: hypothetical protein VGE77_02385 [Nocardioides sp.]
MPSPHRRTVLRAAAWSAPTVAVVAAAPAHAVSTGLRLRASVGTSRIYATTAGDPPALLLDAACTVTVLGGALDELVTATVRWVGAGANAAAARVQAVNQRCDWSPAETYTPGLWYPSISFRRVVTGGAGTIVAFDAAPLCALEWRQERRGTVTVTFSSASALGDAADLTP